MTDPKTPNGPDTPMTLDEAKQRAATLTARLTAERTTARQHAIRHLADLVQGSGAQAVTPVIDAIAEMIGEAVGPVRDGLRLHVDADHAELGTDQPVNLGPTRRITPVAPRGCDDCSVEPGEMHRYPTCPGAERQRDADAIREHLARRATLLADPHPGLATWTQALADVESILLGHAPLLLAEIDRLTWPAPAADQRTPTDRVAKLADRIDLGGFGHGRDEEALHMLASSLLDLAAQAMPDTYLATDARCRLARAVLDALNTNA